jgi:hypothetical protein
VRIKIIVHEVRSLFFATGFADSNT